MLRGRFGIAHLPDPMRICPWSDLNRVVAKAHCAVTAFEKNDLPGLWLEACIFGFPDTTRRKIKRNLCDDAVETIKCLVTQIKTWRNFSNSERTRERRQLAKRALWYRHLKLIRRHGLSERQFVPRSARASQSFGTKRRGVALQV